MITKVGRWTVASVGITFGCFIPMHRGHMDMIDRSRAQNVRTVVAVCGYDGDRGEGFIPFRDRVQLVQEMFEQEPDVSVAVVDDHAIGLTGTFSREAWETWCKELFSSAGLDPYCKDIKYHWYTGEPDYANAIQACYPWNIYPWHNVHLLDRSENPTSGTQIRQGWKQYWMDIHPLFVKYLERSEVL